MAPRQFNSRHAYYLVIEDESGTQLPRRIEFQIDIAMAIDDFNFFDCPYLIYI